MVKGWGLGLTLALLAVTPALAGTNYYIRSDGSNSNDGLTNNSGGAWLTIAHANTRSFILAGDTINIVSVDTTDASFATNYKIEPQLNGSPSAAIVYRGLGAGPENTPVSSINLGYFEQQNKPFGSYIVVTNVRSKASATYGRYFGIGNVLGGRIERCYIAGSIYILGGQDGMFYANRVRGGFNAVCQGWQTNFGNGGVSAAQNDTIRSNTFDPDSLTGFGAMYMRCAANGLVVDSNTVASEFNTGANSFGRAMYNVRNSIFRANSYTLNADVPETHPTQTQYGFYMRDSSSGNVFEDETWVNTGTYAREMLFTASGSYPGTTARNRWQGNRIYSEQTPYAQNGFRSDSLIGNVIVTPTTGILVGGGGSVLMQHNTIVSLRSAPSIEVVGSPFETADIRWNIFARAWSDNCDGDSNDQPIAKLSVSSFGGLTYDENLYWSYAGGGAGIRNDFAVKAGSTCSPADSAGYWRDTLGKDLLSVFADPGLADTAFATFDATPSAAEVGTGWSEASGGYVGAIAPGDATAPDSIAFAIAATGQGPGPWVHRISFEETADDGSTGAAVDSIIVAAIPFAEGIVTEENFASNIIATYLGNEPGLYHELYYQHSSEFGCIHVRIKVVDDAGNVAWSSRYNQNPATCTPP